MVADSNSQTRVVNLIHIKYESGEKKSLLIEMWRMQNNPGRVMRSSPPQVPTKSSSLTVGIVAGIVAEIMVEIAVKAVV